MDCFNFQKSQIKRIKSFFYSQNHNMINIRHLIDEQDNICLETLETYYKFIYDYQNCERKDIKVNKETSELYNSVYQKFIDQTIIFDKISEQSSIFRQTNVNDERFLQINSLIYFYDEMIEQNQYELLDDIMQQIIDIAVEYPEEIDEFQYYQVQILGLFRLGYHQQISDSYKVAEDELKNTFVEIQKCHTLLKQNKDNYSNEVYNCQKEWVFEMETKTLRLLTYNYQKQGQRENLIEHYNKVLKLIKDYEGMSWDYVLTVYNLNNVLGSFEIYRQLQIIEETCSYIDIDKNYVLLQLQRIRFIYQLDQLNKQEYDSILRLHQNVTINDHNFQTVFHSTMLVCAINLKYYSKINKQIDLMFSYITTISDQQLKQVVYQRKQLYEEFLDTKQNHDKNVYENTMLYYQEKAQPFIEEVQRQFTLNYLTLSKGCQREINRKIYNILQDYLFRSLYCHDHNLIRVALEKTINFFQKLFSLIFFFKQFQLQRTYSVDVLETQQYV